MPKSTLATSTIKGTIITRLLSATSVEIGTTWKAFSCNWQDYDLLIFTTAFYNNETESLIAPVFYFATTSSGTRPIIYDPSSSINYQVYQNGDGSIYVVASSESSSYRLKIYGIKFK